MQWTEEMLVVFQATKAALGAATELAHPRQGADLAIMVDASRAPP